ncbi:998_t:CDS:2 [Funneliformis caledonium]|uniref:998_t:CDS:1 n=1 Tax=Funneliformis caledonium TaxID=1117310 RepID=A0A9N9H7L1_9GLOM|nr:998_t:CDS:2 [Funneliformis caledonium]
MDYSTILLASIQSSAQVILVCITGYIAAKLGIINSSLQKGLSGLIIKVLMPCLLFSSIASDIDLETLIKLWPIPTLYVVFSILSGSLGVLGGKVLNLTPAKTKFVMTGIIFNNVTSLSLGLLQGIQNTSAIRISTKGEDDDTKDAVSRGISYILLSTLLGNLSRWSLGTYLLKKESNRDSDEEVDTSSDFERSMSQPLPTYHDDEEQFTTTERTPLIFKRIETEIAPAWKSLFNCVRSIYNSIIEIMNPPLYAAIIALFVGTIPFLKGIFFGDNSPLYGTVTRTMETLGDISVPLNLLTLGAQLKNLPRAKGQEMLPAISWVMMCRFVIMPIIGVTVVIITKDYYLNDPMLWFVLMLLASGPPAVNCMNLSQLTGSFQEEMVALLFYSYAAVAPLIALLIMAMLTIIGKAAPK